MRTNLFTVLIVICVLIGNFGDFSNFANCTISIAATSLLALPWRYAYPRFRQRLGKKYVSTVKGKYYEWKPLVGTDYSRTPMHFGLPKEGVQERGVPIYSLSPES